MKKGRGSNERGGATRGGGSNVYQGVCKVLKETEVYMKYTHVTIGICQIQEEPGGVLVLEDRGGEGGERGICVGLSPDTKKGLIISGELSN